MTRTPLLALLTGLLLGCGKPLPPEKAAYAGEWQEKNMYLLINQDGTVRYKRVRGSTTTSVEGPIKQFEGDNLVVGIGPMTTTFVVGRLPYQEQGRWKMVVDGVELVRTSQ